MNSVGGSNLEKTKILLTTQLKRSNSIITPSLFKFNEHFDYERIIGRSQHSEVWEVVSKVNRRERTAIKRSIRPFVSASDRDKKMHEVQMVTKLGKHPHIVQYYRCWQQDAVFNTQMELCQGGSLNTCKMQFPNMIVPTELTWRIAHEVASGLSQIHTAGMLHLDIKPENIFLDIPDITSCTFKIGDFGLAVLVSERNWEDGDGKYVAPELLCDDTDPTSAADIYSFGATLYECVTGTHPPRNPVAVHAAFPSDVPRELKSLILQMLVHEPEKRPTAEEVLAEVAPHYHPSPIKSSNPPSPEFCYGGFGSHCSSPSSVSPHSAPQESQDSDGFGSPMDDDTQGVQRLTFDRIQGSGTDEVSPIRMLTRLGTCTSVAEDELMESPTQHWTPAPLRT